MVIERIDAYRLLLDGKTTIYLSNKLEKTLEEDALQQLRNAQQIPGVVGVCAMPDVHTGFGLPIGGVMATDADGGTVSPAAVGVDINCGVQLLATNVSESDLLEKKKKLEKTSLYKFFQKYIVNDIPAGEGKNGILRFERNQDNLNIYQDILVNGVKALTKLGLAAETDLERYEEMGAIVGADPSALPDDAHAVGFKQLGSLGSGNHFVEIQAVDEIFDANLASQWGIEPGRIYVMIHSGSRGMGNKTAQHYISNVTPGAMKKHGITSPLGCMPIDTDEGKRYLAAMACAVNWAFANRRIMSAQIQKCFAEYFGEDTKVELIYDVAHNIAKFEEHLVQGRKQKLLVHRKGATRAFTPQYMPSESIFAGTGHPAIIPGSMGTRSWVVVGNEEKIADTFGSVNHGAGRVMSRTAAIGKGKKGVGGKISQDDFEKATLGKGIIVASGTNSDLRDEAPQVYKDSDEVINVIVGAGIARKVAAFRPLAVLKG